MWWNESNKSQLLRNCWHANLARGRVSRWLWHIFLTLKTVTVILVSGQGRTFYCHGDGAGSQLTIILPGTGGDPPIITILWDDSAPPTPVSRFIERPLIGQEGTNAASNWSPLMVYCVVVPIRWAQDTDIRFAVHIRDKFFILTCAIHHSAKLIDIPLLVPRVPSVLSVHADINHFHLYSVFP